MNTETKFNTALAASIILLSTILLIGARFDFSFAGGEGLKRSQTIEINGVEYRRGQMFVANDLQEVQFMSTRLVLEPKTEIEFAKLLQDEFAINVRQGRIVSQGPVTIHTRDVKTHSSGATSFVHYSWLDEIEIAPIEGTVRIELLNQPLDIFEGSALKLHTLPPYQNEPVTFDPATSSAKEFYLQAFTALQIPRDEE